MNRRICYIKSYHTLVEAQDEFYQSLNGDEAEIGKYLCHRKGSDGRFNYAIHPLDSPEIPFISIDIIKAGAEEDLDKPCDLEVWLMQNGFAISENN
jgi:hypothetical protein